MKTFVAIVLDPRSNEPKQVNVFSNLSDAQLFICKEMSVYLWDYCGNNTCIQFSQDPQDKWINKTLNCSIEYQFWFDQESKEILNDLYQKVMESYNSIPNASSDELASFWICEREIKQRI